MYDNSVNAVIFKHEGEAETRHGALQAFGPVWVRRDGKSANYRDSVEKRWDGKSFYPEWFSLPEARKIARKLGLPLEEV